MAHGQELFDCSICLQLLGDPVTTACGHSYCMKCINGFWDICRENGRRGFSCPQCRQTFSTRPDLKKNTLLAALLEEHKRTNSQSGDDGAAAAAADTFTAPDDLQCDVCTGTKRKACKFCLVCLAFFCETHLKPHLEVPPLQKHSLIPASARVADSICSRHHKLLEVYCRTDQQFICLLCVMDEHKHHDTVAVEAEKSELQRQLKRTRLEVLDRKLEAERKIEELKQTADSMRDAAWEACDDLEQLCAEHIRVLVRSVERKCSEMKEKVGEAEKAGLDWTNDHLLQLEREVSDLRRREDELNQLSQTQDPVQFLLGFQAIGGLPVLTDSADRLAEFATAQTDELRNICNKAKRELLSHSEDNVVSKNPRLWKEKITRTYLLTKYEGSTVEVDPNTVPACLSLSNRNREISWRDQDQAHPDLPDRFTFYHQALCKKGLEDSHYWEVEWDGGIVDLAVSYRGIERKGSSNDCCFGHNKISWKLTCSSSGCTFWHNNLHKGQIPAAVSRRVGIHLEYEEGTLGFYSVSDSGCLTALHQVQTKFTEPLYPGFSVYAGSTLKICDI